MFGKAPGMTVNRPRGLFAKPDAAQFMPQMDAGTQGAVDQYAAMPMQPKPQGKPNWLGVLADALAGAAGKEPMYLNSVLAQRDAEAKAQQEAAKQEADWTMFQRKFDYEQANKVPTPNDTERDYQFMVDRVGEPAAKAWLERRGDPFVNMTLPNGQFYSGPQSGLQTALGGNQATPPPKPVGRLTPIAGGPTPPASGRFR